MKTFARRFFANASPTIDIEMYTILLIIVTFRAFIKLLKLTWAIQTTANITFLTSATETAIGVFAFGVDVTHCNVVGAFVDIWNGVWPDFH